MSRTESPTRFARPLSRREFLKAAGLGLAAAPLLAGCRRSSSGGQGTAAPGKEMTLWWWGEQEAAGMTRWMDAMRAEFEKETGVHITPTLMDTDQVVSQFTTAAAAGNVPDVQFLYNGIYHMENVWLGYIAPLNGLVSDAVLQKSGATPLSVFEGKQYRLGAYNIGFGIAYNKEQFSKAGLNADDPPKTWDAFLNACDRLKAAGLTPIGGGVKDGYFGEWFLTNALTQNLDSPGEALDLFAGTLDWREPKYHEPWIKLEELKQRGFLNDDIGSLELYQGTQLYDTGKAAMCLQSTAALPHSQESLGREKVGYMVMPVFGTGKMAGIPILDAQGYGIPSRAKNPQLAAKFLEFLHTKPHVQALWTMVRQVPSDSDFDSSVVDDPLLKTIIQKWMREKHNVYIADLMPTQFWTEAMFVISQKILAGELTGAQSGELAHTVKEKWKSQHPDLALNYARWAKTLGA
ncbi:MAG TPA: extracellular solute-binding protein [Chthonomonadaceae bacterium]|nr:extracellular solute-binding protein [Chthonomonadaceae bacterium]